MSGIAGIFSLCDTPFDTFQVSAMLATIQHRGSHGMGTWVSPQVGLGHVLLHTTPESLLEHQPFQDGPYCITADARLDNRAELIDLLGFPESSANDLTDCEIILRAYITWGSDCPYRLLGDFAFAIWDGNKEELFCARDVFGAKSFYYYATSCWFIFGSEIKAILSCPQVSGQPNEMWLGNFFMPSASLQDKASTSYQDIFRLPPAHFMRITRTGRYLESYWSLDPEKEVRFQSDAEYGEAARFHFMNAVQRRMRSAFPVGSTLSGGLDSSSIACMMRMLNQGNQDAIHTYSAVFDHAPDANESEYIDAVLNMGGFHGHKLHPDQQSPFIDLDRVLRHLDEPFFATNYFMPWSFYKCASEDGVRVLLDGTDGDTTVSHGMDYLDMLAYEGRWLEFSKEAKAITRKFAHPIYASTPGILNKFGAPHLTNLARKGKWGRFAREINQVHKNFNFSQRKLVLNLGVKPLLPKPFLNAWQVVRGKPSRNQMIPAYINPEFAGRYLSAQNGLNGSSHNGRGSWNNGHRFHFEYLNSGLLPYSLEFLTHLSAAFSVELRFPFCDRELAEFCLSVPPEQKLHNGWSRYYFRNAMQGILPEEVRCRPGKISLAQVYPYMLERYARDYVEEMLYHPPDMLHNYLNMSVIQDYYQQFITHQQDENLSWVWQTVVFAAWFEKTKFAV